jgi:hypothetical protein
VSEAGAALLWRPGLPDPTGFFRFSYAWPLGPERESARFTASYSRAIELVHPIGDRSRRGVRARLRAAAARQRARDVAPACLLDDPAQCRLVTWPRRGEGDEPAGQDSITTSVTSSPAADAHVHARPAAARVERARHRCGSAPPIRSSRVGQMRARRPRPARQRHSTGALPIRPRGCGA